MKRITIILSVAALLILGAVFAFAATSATIVLNAPAGISAYYDRDGNTYIINSSGQITVKTDYLNDALRAGFTPNFNYGAQATVTCTKGAVITTPTAYTGHGVVQACYSTNAVIPIGKY